MFARRRMEEAAKRAANKSKAQSERHSENHVRHAAVGKGKNPKGGKDGADSEGTK